MAGRISYGEGSAVLAFNPAGLFATAGPGRARGRVAVLGDADHTETAASLGFGRGEDVGLGQSVLLNDGEHLGNGSGLLGLERFGDLGFEMGFLLQQRLVVGSHIYQ